MKRDGRRERGRAKIMLLLKLKTKQAKVVVAGDLLAQRWEGNERRRGEKVEIGGKRMKKWKVLG
jgi:hypothetical protein